MGKGKGCRARKKLKAAKWGKFKQQTMNEMSSKKYLPNKERKLNHKRISDLCKKKKDNLIKEARLDKLLNYASSIDPNIKSYNTLDTELEFNEETCSVVIPKNNSTTTIHSFLPATKTTGNTPFISNCFSKKDYYQMRHLPASMIKNPVVDKKFTPYGKTFRNDSEKEFYFKKYSNNPEMLALYGLTFEDSLTIFTQPRPPYMIPSDAPLPLQSLSEAIRFLQSEEQSPDPSLNQPPNEINKVTTPEQTIPINLSTLSTLQPRKKLVKEYYDSKTKIDFQTPITTFSFLQKSPKENRVETMTFHSMEIVPYVTPIEDNSMEIAPYVTPSRNHSMEIDPYIVSGKAHKKSTKESKKKRKEKKAKKSKKEKNKKKQKRRIQLRHIFSNSEEEDLSIPEIDLTGDDLPELNLNEEDFNDVLSAITNTPYTEKNDFHSPCPNTLLSPINSKVLENNVSEVKNRSLPPFEIFVNEAIKNFI